MRNGLVLLREIYTDKSTIGKLFLDGEFVCDTLEDTCRKEKIAGVTAIPSGIYEVIINESSRFKRKMPLLLKVPYFEGVRIHNGNTAEHSLGCILVGDRDMTQPNFIGNSRATFEEVFKKIEEALAKSNLFISVVGGYSLEDFELYKKLNKEIKHEENHS